MLKWDPVAVMSCLEVLPVEDEDAAGLEYTVMKSGMRLVLTVYPYHGDVSVSLYRDGVIDPALSLNLFGCDAIRCIRFKGYDALEFGAGRLFAGHYDGDGPIPYGIRIRVMPSIAIDTFRYPV